MQNPDNNSNKITELFKDEPQKALKMFFDQYFGKLKFYAESIVHDIYVAEDLAIEAFPKLYKIKDNFSRDIDVKAFLYRTVTNACFNYIRNSKVREANKQDYLYFIGETTQEDTETAIDNRVILEEAYKSTKELSPRKKEIFDKIFDENLTPQEIADELELSDATIRAQKFQIIASIREYLGNKRLLSWLICFLGSF